MTTIAEAFATAEPATLDSVTRDSDLLSLGKTTREHLHGLVLTVRESYPKISWADAEEATGEALVRIIERASTIDASRPPWGIVIQLARWILQDGFAERRRMQSIEGLYATSGDDAFCHARPVRPDSPTMRFDLNPKQKEMAEQLIAFRDGQGRPPTARECDGDPSLPSRGALAHHFGSFNKALIAAGMLPKQAKRRRWSEAEAVEVLVEYRRRHGAFPTSREIRDGTGLPATKTMLRFFGSTSPRKYAPKVLAAAEALEQG